MNVIPQLDDHYDRLHVIARLEEMFMRCEEEDYAVMDLDELRDHLGVSDSDYDL